MPRGRTKKVAKASDGIKLPIIFQFRAKNHRIVNPNNPPRMDKRTGEALWGDVVVAKEGEHFCDSMAQAKWMMSHAAFGTDFWIKGDRPSTASKDRVVSVVTTTPALSTVKSGN